MLFLFFFGMLLGVYWSELLWIMSLFCAVYLLVCFRNILKRVLLFTFPRRKNTTRESGEMMPMCFLSLPLIFFSCSNKDPTLHSLFWLVSSLVLGHKPSISKHLWNQCVKPGKAQQKQAPLKAETNKTHSWKKLKKIRNAKRRRQTKRLGANHLLASDLKHSMCRAIGFGTLKRCWLQVFLGTLCWPTARYSSLILLMVWSVVLWC